MSTRQLGEVAVKILGVYLAASALISVTSVASSFALPRIEGLPNPGELLRAIMAAVAETQPLG